MARKYRFGLANTKYAIWDEATQQYGQLKALPGARALTLSTEGGDSSDFYADNGIWATFAGTNGGYSGDLELANLPDEVRADLLGEVVDDVTGVQFETTDAEPPEFALITEMITNEGTMAFAFYNVKASRPEINANTKGESIDVDTESLPLRIGARDFVYNDETRKFVQGHIDKASTTAAKYRAFFQGVVIPSAGADASLSALAIGSLVLDPAFDPDTLEYIATTENATNTITATASDAAAVIAITVGETVIENGGSATWETGENTVTVTVTNGESSRAYTVIVEKTE